jgi:hypothetical protein
VRCQLPPPPRCSNSLLLLRQAIEELNYEQLPSILSLDYEWFTADFETKQLLFRFYDENGTHISIFSPLPCHVMALTRHQ